ncbi:ACT domain-containing protein [Nocardioides sp.]|uniref:ACT domain-containing protein n=1 Tax=Nocardioides sp. TaxID=35761 RepID=UPI00356A6FFD
MTDLTTPESTEDESGLLRPPESGPSYSLQQFPEKLAVIKLPVGAEIPAWAESSSLFSVTATATSTSVVCAGRDVPTKVTAERGLFGFAVQDAPDHDQAGILVDLLTPLAAAGISIFAISTYDTIWILVKVADAEGAAQAWTAAGHQVQAAVPVKPTRKGKKK